LGVVILVTAIVIAIIWRASGSGPGWTPATEDSNSSRPSGSVWDETSSPSPPPPRQSNAQLVDCPDTNMRTDTTRQSGNRLSSAELSVERIPGWTDSVMGMGFIFDWHGQQTSVTGSWVSEHSVGRLDHGDGFVDIRQSAEQVMQCWASSGYYPGFTHSIDLTSKQIEINGAPAWYLETEIYVDRTDVEGDISYVIVVDLGPDKDYLGLYLGCCTIDDTDRCNTLQAAIQTLSVNR
jgi:hypothetical protein